MATPMPAQGPFCPMCGGAAVWHASVGQWGCDRCRQLLPNQAPQPSSQHAFAPNPQGFAPGVQPMPPPQPGPPPPQCPQCGSYAVWHPAANGWGCDRCRQMLQVQVQPTNEMSSGVKILLNVIIFIVSVAILVAIKVAFRH